MIDDLIIIISAVVVLTVVFGTLPLVIILTYGHEQPPAHAERLLNAYIEPFAAGASVLIAVLSMFRRKDTAEHVPSTTKELSSPPGGQPKVYAFWSIIQEAVAGSQAHGTFGY
jgi:hypothetical protein